MGRIIPALAVCAATFAVTPATAQNGESGAASAPSLLVPPAPYDSETRQSPSMAQSKIIQVPQPPQVTPAPQPPEVTQAPQQPEVTKPPQVTQAPEPPAATPAPEQTPVVPPVAEDKAPEPAIAGGIDKAPEEKKPSEAPEAKPEAPADKPTAVETQKDTAEPTTEAKPSDAPEAKPNDTAEGKPGSPVETRPSDAAKAKPKAPAETKPAANAETKPGTPAETKPNDAAEAKPNGAVEEKPASTAESKPNAPTETKPGGTAEARPNANAESKQNGVAEAKPPSDNADGRFTFSRMNDGYVRLDNRTGQVSFCGKRSVGWTCQLAPDDRGVLENEIARLQEENVILKRDLLGRGLPLPGTVKPEPQPRASQNERAPFSLPHDPNIERMKVMVEKMWRQLVDMITALQKDVLKKS
jgi:hypothetical protein